MVSLYTVYHYATIGTTHTTSEDSPSPPFSLCMLAAALTASTSFPYFKNAALRMYAAKFIRSCLPEGGLGILRNKRRLRRVQPTPATRHGHGIPAPTPRSEHLWAADPRLGLGWPTELRGHFVMSMKNVFECICICIFDNILCNFECKIICGEQRM